MKVAWRGSALLSSSVGGSGVTGGSLAEKVVIGIFGKWDRCDRESYQMGSWP